MTLATIVRGRREELGLTQLELAECAKMSERQLKRIEKGETLRPARSTLVALARCLELEVDQLPVPPEDSSLFPAESLRRLRRIELTLDGMVSALEDIDERVFQLEAQGDGRPARVSPQKGRL